MPIVVEFKDGKVSVKQMSRKQIRAEIKKETKPLPCRFRGPNPDKSSPFQFWCAAAKSPIDGEVLPRLKGELKKGMAYLSCSYCILYNPARGK